MISQTNINLLIVCTFSIIMLIAFSHALKVYYVNSKNNAINFYANTLTSLGILGTFVGIALGILYFDTTVVDDSLLHMIDGFKTAFITSIIGLALSLLLKQIAFIKPISKPDNTQEGSLLRLEKAIDLQTSIYTNAQNTLSTAIVTSLEDIIQNFNSKIEAQFGSNLKAVASSIDEINKQFTQLNKNIGVFEEQTTALNIAVESFENVHAKSYNALNTLVKSIEKTDMLFDAIGKKSIAHDKHAEQIQKSSEHIHLSLEKVDTQFTQINDNLKHISSEQNNNNKAISTLFKDQYKESQQHLFETIESMSHNEKDAYSKLLNEIKSTTELQHTFTNQLNKNIESHNEANILTIKKTQELSDSMNEFNTTNHSFMNDITQRLLNEIDTMTQKQYEQFSHSQLKVNTHIETALAQHNQQHAQLLDTHYSLFEEQLNNEMRNTFEQLSKIMGFVSGEFARDFQQLIDQMNTVKVEMNKQALSEEA